MRNWRNRSGGNQMEQIPLHHVGLAASGAAGGRAIPFPDRPVFQRISEIISKIIRLNALTSPNAPMSLTQTAHKPSSLRRLAAWYRGAVPGHQTSISLFNLLVTVHSGTTRADRGGRTAHKGELSARACARYGVLYRIPLIRTRAPIGAIRWT
jgi:hypothetical protein